MENDFDYEDDSFLENCPKCSRLYDHIDFDYQSCSKCGWDAEKNEWGKRIEPTDDDYLAGEADILTGQWY